MMDILPPSAWGSLGWTGLQLGREVYQSDSMISTVCVNSGIILTLERV